MAAFLVAGLPSVAQAATLDGHTIGSAPNLVLGQSTSGGNGAIDFWKVTLIGGDQLQIVAKTPNVGCCQNYDFDLYAPGTTDANFPTANIVMGTNSPGGDTGTSTMVLQAPYNGTFILAVCEQVSGDCRNVDSGQGVNPMASYSFTPSLVGGGVKASVGAEETRASTTIAKAPLTPIGHFEAGGGNGVDFWKVHLIGGDKVQINVQTPYVGCCGDYDFDLYAPGTTDGNFPNANLVMTSGTPGGDPKSILVLQAPYTGTFLLAVCEQVGGDCRNVDNGQGANPMSPYTFTPSLIGGGVKATVGAKETRASTTIAKAPLTPLGNFEAGGGNGIDFWKIHLLAGDKMQISAQTPYVGCCVSYDFDLYRQGTTDTNFPQANPVATGGTPGGDTQFTMVLRVRTTGTFLLAVCEQVGGDCRNVDNGQGANPMSPYTFTTSRVGGRETRTTLRLSAATITSGHEKALKLSVAVAAVFSGHPTGKVTIRSGRRKICGLTLIRGRGTCSPGSNTLLAPGTYSLIAYYAGSKSFAPSTSTAKKLKVRR